MLMKTRVTLKQYFHIIMRFPSASGEKKLSNRTGVLVRVEIVEIVGLLAELHARSSSTELLHQERVVLLHDLPDQLSWHRRHLSSSFTCTWHQQIDDFQMSEIRGCKFSEVKISLPLLGFWVWVINSSPATQARVSYSFTFIDITAKP